MLAEVASIVAPLAILCARLCARVHSEEKQADAKQAEKHNTKAKREHFSIVVLLCGFLRIPVRQSRIARILFRLSAANKGIWKETALERVGHLHLHPRATESLYHKTYVHALP